jgi:hypothetical protein
MNRHIIKEDLQLWDLPTNVLIRPQTQAQVQPLRPVHTNLQSKIRFDVEPANEVILYPWRRWYKSEYNIN